MELGVVVRVHVDETGRQHQPIGVDHLSAVAPRRFPTCEIRPSRTSTSAEKPGIPVPSTTCAPRMSSWALFHGFSVPKSTGRTSGSVRQALRCRRPRRWGRAEDRATARKYAPWRRGAPCGRSGCRGRRDCPSRRPGGAAADGRCRTPRVIPTGRVVVRRRDHQVHHGPGGDRDAFDLGVDRGLAPESDQGAPNGGPPRSPAVSASDRRTPP